MRRLVAVLACRAASSRLYCKPLQSIGSASILENIIATLRAKSCISEIVLAIADTSENECFRHYARRENIPYILGDENDVLSRLIQGGRFAASTDVFRVTTESPFVWHEPIERLWQEHVSQGNDISVTDNLPIGAHCEIYTLAALEASHDRGEARHRSELCSLYAREHPEQFRTLAIWPSADLRRTDIRVTVDYPEDLIVCRALFEKLGSPIGSVKISELIKAFDQDVRYQDLLSRIPKASLFWKDAPTREWVNG